jgi:hypothetical protein
MASVEFRPGGPSSIYTLVVWLPGSQRQGVLHLMDRWVDGILDVTR